MTDGDEVEELTKILASWKESVKERKSQTCQKELIH